MKPAMACAVLALACAGCGPHGGTGSTGDRTAMSVFWNAFWDELRGEPGAEALASSATFHGAGIRFDYPAVLRRSHERHEDGRRSWSFERGMFELQLVASPQPMSGADLLGMLGYVLDGGKTMQAGALEDGPSAWLCGHQITSSRLRLRILGDWSEQHAFDLPAPPGESRLLLFDDELVNDRGSAVGSATWERVLGSLQCDPAFLPAPVEAPERSQDTDGDSEVDADLAALDVA